MGPIYSVRYPGRKGMDSGVDYEYLRRLAQDPANVGAVATTSEPHGNLVLSSSRTWVYEDTGHRPN